MVRNNQEKQFNIPQDVLLFFLPLFPSLSLSSSSTNGYAAAAVVVLYIVRARLVQPAEF